MQRGVSSGSDLAAGGRTPLGELRLEGGQGERGEGEGESGPKHGAAGERGRVGNRRRVAFCNSCPWLV